MKTERIRGLCGQTQHYTESTFTEIKRGRQLQEQKSEISPLKNE